jgi:hypothetical protein
MTSRKDGSVEGQETERGEWKEGVKVVAGEMGRGWADKQE